MLFRSKDELKKIGDGNADYVHIDVMDGQFVPNIAIGIPVVKSLRKCSDLFFDVHLMIEEPIRYIDKFAAAGADGITVHIEACKDMDKTLEAIQSAGIRPAISINPDTSVELVYPYLDRVDMILLMSVYPGHGGQKLIEGVLDKARVLRAYLCEHDLDVDIEMDGGIKLTNADTVVKAGVNVVVAGTGVFRGDFNQNVLGFHNIFELYGK